MRRALLVIAAVVGVQAALVGMYLLVERARDRAALGEALDAPAPELRFETPEGATRLTESSGPLLLHFWATWCPPCRDELPALLDYAAEAPFTVRAVSLDEDWPILRRFFGGELPTHIARSTAAAAAAYRIEQLPVTFVIRDGRVVRRIDGARDWRDPRLRRTVEAAAQPAK